MKYGFETLEIYFKQMPSFWQQHSISVERYVRAIAKRIKELQSEGRYTDWELPSYETVGMFGRYHDLGKSGISDELLDKKGSFTDGEFKLAQTHTVIGAIMVKNKLSDKDLKDSSDMQNIMAQCCLYHHERWDGKGYPFGLKGDNIPICARIIAVADAYDAMTVDRPYKKKVTKDEALKEVLKEAGKQFDPELAEIFVTILKE